MVHSAEFFGDNPFSPLISEEERRSEPSTTPNVILKDALKSVGYRGGIRLFRWKLTKRGWKNIHRGSEIRAAVEGEVLTRLRQNASRILPGKKIAEPFMQAITQVVATFVYAGVIDGAEGISDLQRVITSSNSEELPIKAAIMVMHQEEMLGVDTWKGKRHFLTGRADNWLRKSKSGYY